MIYIKIIKRYDINLRNETVTTLELSNFDHIQTIEGHTEHLNYNNIALNVKNIAGKET